MSSMAVIENLYYTVNLDIPWNDEKLNVFRDSFASLKDKAQQEDVFITVNGVNSEVSPSGMKRYPFKLHVEDKADIYFANSAMGSNYPIYVMLYAKYMWLNDLDTCTAFVNSFILDFIKSFVIDAKILDVKINRTDFACHNTYITDLMQWLPESKLFKKVIFPSKNVSKYYSEKPGLNDDVTDNNGVVYGKGDLLVRIYDKTREIIEMQHKEFFIPLWYENKLISKYDYDVYTAAFGLGSRSYEYSVTYGMYKYYEKEFLINFDLINKYYAAEYKKLVRFATVFDAMQNAFNIGITGDYIKYVKRIFRLYNKYVKSVIDCPKSVFNVEFQVRRPVLKQCAFIENSCPDVDGVVQEVYSRLDSIDSLKKNAQVIFDYLTHDCFRVIQEGTATRKTRCRTDLIWQQIQDTKMYGFPRTENVIMLREYSHKMDKAHTVQRSVSNLAHLAYINGQIDKYIINDDVIPIPILNMVDMLHDDIADFTERQIVNMENAVKRQLRMYGRKSNSS